MIHRLELKRQATRRRSPVVGIEGGALSRRPSGIRTSCEYLDPATALTYYREGTSPGQVKDRLECGIFLNCKYCP
uniref:Uncharacterized protein n=2 Tax=Oryza TaxID=4527 RepID=D4QDA9_ORYRU|nr:hypothetical protein [Oryza rufipogon]BAI94526.1 hypothetical protein [Oryza sativa Indica Group]